MPPTTEDGLEAEKRLDDKLAAFYAEETGQNTAQPAVEEEVPAVEEAVEPETAEEPAAETTEAAAPDDPDVASYLAKYGGDTGKALRAAVEAQQLIGRQGQEIGELRRAFDEQIQQIQAQVQQTQYATRAPDAVERLVEQGNYHAAAEYARQAQDAGLYQHVLSHWLADPDQQFAGVNYHTTLVAQAQTQQVEQLIDQRLAGVTATTGELAEERQRTTFERDFRTFSQGKDDIASVTPEMLRVAQEYENVVSPLLASPDPQTRQQAFEFLYTQARGRVGDTLAKAAQEAAAGQQQAAREAKQKATVGSPSTQSQATTPTPVDAFKAEFRKVLFDDPTSIQKGLTRDTQ